MQPHVERCWSMADDGGQWWTMANVGSGTTRLGRCPQPINGQGDGSWPVRPIVFYSIQWAKMVVLIAAFIDPVLEADPIIMISMIMMMLIIMIMMTIQDIIYTGP